MTRRIVVPSLALSAIFTGCAFGAGWMTAARSQVELLAGDLPGWSDLVLNNLLVALILCSGVVSGSLTTLFLGSLSLFVTGATFGAAVFEHGLLHVVVSSPHMPFEALGLLVAGGVGFWPLPVAWSLLRADGRHFRRDTVTVLGRSVFLVLVLVVVGSLIEVHLSFRLAAPAGP